MSQLGIFKTVARTELKEIDPQISNEALLYLNTAIQAAFELGFAFARNENKGFENDQANA